MAHNPRRARSSESVALPVTNDQIAEAMARAVELRRKTASDSALVDAVALDARDAVRATEGWRLNTRRHRIGRDADADPWHWVGWVGVEVPWDHATELGRRCYAATWQVWLNAEDGRVWLRLERHGRWAEDGDPYP